MRSKPPSSWPSEGIEAEVDRPAHAAPARHRRRCIASVRKTNRIVTVEEGWPICSIGSEICARVALRRSTISTRRRTKITGADVPMPYAANLEKLRFAVG